VACFSACAQVASLLGLDKVFALWLAGESCEPSGAHAAPRSRPAPSLRKRLRTMCDPTPTRMHAHTHARTPCPHAPFPRSRGSVRNARDDYRATLAKALYFAACVAIVIDRVIFYGFQHDSYPSFVVSRVSGGLIALNSVLVRACGARGASSTHPHPRMLTRHDAPARSCL
jgi:hypothetical protein